MPKTDPTPAELDAHAARTLGWTSHAACSCKSYCDRCKGYRVWWERGDEVRHGNPPPYATATTGSPEAAILAMEMIGHLVANINCPLVIHLDTDSMAVYDMMDDGDEYPLGTSCTPNHVNDALARAVVAVGEKGGE